jgi:succinyl-diaminopimelate desuccinylase
MDRTVLDAWFQKEKPNMIRDLQRLVAIRSVREEAKENMPFGEGPAEALKECLAIARELGFEVKNCDNYVGTVLLNDQPLLLDILGHLDVVEEGDGWSTPPYELVEKDGMLYGRGTDDDKGPLIAALYAMRAVKELCGPLPYNARIILGTDEESGFSDIRYFFAQTPHATYTFSPDSSFPVTNIEKGSFKPVFQKQWETEAKGKRITMLHGGEQINVVPPVARAEVEGFSMKEIQAHLAEAELKTGIRYTVQPKAKGLLITANGKSAHASTPEEGNNALTGLIDLLCRLPFDKHESIITLHNLNALFPHGETNGASLEIALQDEKSGALTLAFSICDLDLQGIRAQFDSRTPLCAGEENCCQIVRQTLSRLGFSVTGEAEAPHDTDGSTPFVRTLLECYEEFTGRKGKCLYSGGGTYVHNIPGGVAFGASMPDFESNLHGADEHICINDWMTAAKIFSQAIWKICGGTMEQ